MEKNFRQKPNGISTSSRVFFRKPLAVPLLGTKESRSHMLRVRLYADHLVTAMEKNGQEFAFKGFKDKVVCFVSLHDIGKSRVPQEILTKPSSLSLKEKKIIQKHPDLGIEMLNELGTSGVCYKTFCQDQILRNIVQFHHEKFDGTGYPLRLKGKEIPLEARIMSIVDVFDAMSSPRCYKEQLSIESVSEYILDNKGAHFDPEICEIFWKNKEDFFNISKNKQQEMKNSLFMRMI